MSEQQVKERARERLLAAELAEVLQVDAAAITAGESEPPRRQHGWLAAALVLLGVAVAAGVAWLRTEEAREAAQGAFDPANPWWEDEVPFSVPMVVVRSPEEVQALPASTVRITVSTPEASPGTISAALRREDLRQLLLVHGRPETPSIPWPEITARASLRSLGFLTLIVDAQQLAQLRQLPLLRALTLSHGSVEIDAKIGAALAGLKTLQHLNIAYDEVDPEGLARLAELPALTSLVLGVAQSGPGDLTAQLAAVAKIRTLRSLFFNGDMNPMPADAVRQLRSLPDLIALQLSNFDLDDDGLAALPRTLQQLQLPKLGAITPTGIAGLAELGSLRSLGFHLGLSAEHDAAVRDLVPKLPLECFECLSALPSDALWTVIEGLPLLRRVRVQIGDEDPRATFEHALACRKLEVLFVSVPQMPTPEQLGLLREHATLRRIVLRRYRPMTPVPTEAELNALRASVHAAVVVL